MSRNFTPDKILIDQLLLNDTEAFEELYHRHCYPLYNYCNEKLNSPADARAIVRDIFIGLWEKRQTLPVVSVPESSESSGAMCKSKTGRK